MKDFIEYGDTKWNLIKGTKVMHFKAGNWNDRVRLEFAINCPFDCCFIYGERENPRPLGVG